ncbi:MAG: hypothetical protein ACK5LL_04080 [Suipraeoptans sp.]
MKAMIYYEAEDIIDLRTASSFIEPIIGSMNNGEHKTICSLVSAEQIIERICGVFENELLIKLEDEKKAVSKKVVDITYIKSMDELYALIDKMKKSKQEVEHQSNLSMTPMEFSKFMRDWIDAHMEDPELTPGYVERMFKTPANIYQRSHKKK